MLPALGALCFVIRVSVQPPYLSVSVCLSLFGWEQIFLSQPFTGPSGAKPDDP